jgi:hypothetical protein
MNFMQSSFTLGAFRAAVLKTVLCAVRQLVHSGAFLPLFQNDDSPAAESRQSSKITLGAN